MSDLQNQVMSIITDLENGINRESCTECNGTLEKLDDLTTASNAALNLAPNGTGTSDFCPECGEHCTDTLSGFDYIGDALEIDYTVTSSKAFKGASLLVAFGGPNIWIHAKDGCGIVEGHWWGESIQCSYTTDAMDIHGAASELFEC